MWAVADSGPIIHLAWIGHLHLLRTLLDVVLIPPAVFREITAAPIETLGQPAIDQALRDGWLVVRIPAAGPLASLAERDAGEAEAIPLLLRRSTALSSLMMGQPESKRSAGTSPSPGALASSWLPGVVGSWARCWRWCFACGNWANG